MAVFAGPYTPDSDLSFAPWQSALAALREEAVDVVILVSGQLLNMLFRPMPSLRESIACVSFGPLVQRYTLIDPPHQLGPFLDSAHPLIKTGDADEPLHRMFLRRFLMPLRRWLNGVGPVGGGGGSGGAGGGDATTGEGGAGARTHSTR